LDGTASHMRLQLLLTTCAGAAIFIVLGSG
jgi:hypothetical protein